MSNVISRPACPESESAASAPITPAAGPERSVRTGDAAAAFADSVPPFDWTTRSVRAPRRRALAASRER